jgi:hypothetical protein
VSLQSRDKQLFGKLSKFVCNWRGKVFRAAAAAAREDRVAKWRLRSKRRSVSCRIQNARNTFPRQLQTNFESFSDNCCISRDCRLTGYFIINMLKCYLLFELSCIFFKTHISSCLIIKMQEPTESCTDKWQQWRAVDPFCYLCLKINIFINFHICN